MKSIKRHKQQRVIRIPQQQYSSSGSSSCSSTLGGTLSPRMDLVLLRQTLLTSTRSRASPASSPDRTGRPMAWRANTRVKQNGGNGGDLEALPCLVTGSRTRNAVNATRWQHARIYNGNYLLPNDYKKHKRMKRFVTPREVNLRGGIFISQQCSMSSPELGT